MRYRLVSFKLSRRYHLPIALLSRVDAIHSKSSRYHCHEHFKLTRQCLFYQGCFKCLQLVKTCDDIVKEITGSKQIYVGLHYSSCFYFLEGKPCVLQRGFAWQTAILLTWKVTIKARRGILNTHQKLQVFRALG